MRSLVTFDRKLRVEMDSGAPFLLFGYTFTSPGVAVFATNRSDERLSVINVVSEIDQCGPLSANWPYPATLEALNTLSVTVADVVISREPDWVVTCIVFAFMLLAVFAIICIQRLVRNKYYTSPPPLQVEHDIPDDKP